MMHTTDFFKQEIPRFKSKIDTQSQEYQQNYAGMSKLVQQLQERLGKAREQGEAKYVNKHIKVGQLLARDRVELLLDEDSPFVELMPFAGFGRKKCTIGASIVAGIGLVCGVECMVVANVATLKGGAINKASVEKMLRLNEIAMQNRLPTISLMQSAGADLTQQAKVFHLGGAQFRDLAVRSKACIPTITVVFGSSTAGGAYSPGLSDYVIMVKKFGKMYLAGPPLVKMATSEQVDDETLGGAEMHSKLSGCSDFLAQNEYHAIRLARDIVASLNYTKATPLPKDHYSLIEEPLYSPDELLGVVSDNLRIPVDSREVIARIVDGSRFAEFKPLYGSTLVTGFARVHGIQVGILANNGILFSEAANKGTQFIQLCNQKNVPLLYLQNITGFMVGKKYEQEGMIKNGAKMINSVSNSGVPSITIVFGASYGAGNYAMAGREYNPRFLFSWVNSRCSVMGSEQLAGVMDILLQQKVPANKMTPQIKAMAEKRKQEFITLVDNQSDVYFTSARMIDDGIIDPRDTRNIVGFCLSVMHSGEIKGDNNFGIARM